MSGTRRPNIRVLLAMMLFVFIPGEISILGKVYYAVANLRYDTMQSEYQALLLPTIILPLLILVLRNWRTSRARRTPVAAIFALGIWCWLLGSFVSAVAHHNMPMTVLVFFSGAVSGFLVYSASTHLRLSQDSVEQIVRCFLIGGLLPGVEGIWYFYHTWGIPDLSTLLYARYDVVRMQPYSLAVAQTGAAACFFVLLAAPCMAILALRLFHRSTRVLVRLTLFFCILNLIIDQARTAFIDLVATWLLILLFVRGGRRAIGAAVAVFCLFSFLPDNIVNSFYENLGRALTYDQADHSARDRLESIKFGWTTFIDNPLYGVGPGQSASLNPFAIAHDLIISQASEVGFLGLIGILLITISCIIKTFGLIREGPQNELRRLRFVFILGPMVYFGTGMVSAVFVYNIFQNAWICLACGLVGLSEAHYSRQIQLSTAPHSVERLSVSAPVWMS